MADEDKSTVSSLAREEGSTISEQSSHDYASTGAEYTHTSSTRTRPKQVEGRYPVRVVTWYQINSSDIKSIGIAQAAATIFFSLGTFALGYYLDLTNSMAAAKNAGEELYDFMATVMTVAFWLWLVFWGIGLAAFVWQGTEWRRIKTEHGEPTATANLTTLLGRDRTD